MCRNARAARGHSGRPDAGRSGGGARFSARCRGPGSLRHRNSDKQSGCPGENRSRYRGDVRQGQSRCGSRSMAGSEPTPVAAELCHAWLILRTRPVLLEPGAVLAAVKDAARRTSERRPAAILDRCCARPPAGRQAGTKKRPPVSRTKKHDEVGNTGLPSKSVSLLPMINSEEAQKGVRRSRREWWWLSEGEREKQIVAGGEDQECGDRRQLVEEVVAWSKLCPCGTPKIVANVADGMNCEGEQVQGDQNGECPESGGITPPSAMAAWRSRPAQTGC